MHEKVEPNESGSLNSRQPPVRICPGLKKRKHGRDLDLNYPSSDEMSHALTTRSPCLHRGPGLLQLKSLFYKDRLCSLLIVLLNAIRFRITCNNYVDSLNLHYIMLEDVTLLYITLYYTVLKTALYITLIALVTDYFA